MVRKLISPPDAQIVCHRETEESKSALNVIHAAIEGRATNGRWVSRSETIRKAIEYAADNLYEFVSWFDDGEP